MSLVYNGINTDTVIYNGQPTTGLYNGTIVWGGTAPVDPDPYNPLNLPPYTMRLKYTAPAYPNFDVGTLTVVEETSDYIIIDWLYENDNWTGVCSGRNGPTEILGANSTNVTNMDDTFSQAGFLETINIFDTSNVTSMNKMFYLCTSLKNLPLFNTNKVVNIDESFALASNVSAGVLELYNQLSTQTNVPTSHYNTFMNCGLNATSGYEILQQIPTAWGGYNYGA